MKEWGLKETAFVIFGSSGNLASTSLIPALEKEESRSRVRRRISIVGVDVKPPTRLPHGVPFRFVRGDFLKASTFGKLAATLRDIGSPSEIALIFYLATRPELYRTIVDGIGEEGLNHGGPVETRIALEKPFGLDGRSCRTLQKGLDRSFEESQVYRVDHFLENSAVQGFGSFLSEQGLESLWNRDYIGQVWIRADERTGVDGRGEFYDSVGVVRDMVQNHLLQLLCTVAVAPASVRPPPGDSKSAKIELLESARKVRPRDFVLGQYSTYREVTGVGRRSATPTFFQGELKIDNEHWKGVPFMLRTGKKLARDLTEIAVSFKKEHVKTFGDSKTTWDRIRLRLDRPEHVEFLRRGGRSVGVVAAIPQGKPGVTAHDRLVRDLIIGNRTPFVERGFNELAWKIMKAPLEEGDMPKHGIETYGDGTEGPRALEILDGQDA